MSLLLATSLSYAEGLSWNEWQEVHAKGATVLQLTIDNDSLLLKKDDGFYTSGNRIATSYVLSSAKQAISYGWQLGQDLYTSSDINLLPNQIAKNDHPYAGWLFAGAYREVNDAGGAASRIGLDVGCLGPCAGGEWAQTHLHRLIRQPLPQGWSTQLRNEWGMVASGEWTPARWTLMPGMDFAPRLKGRFGNIFTDAATDVSLRLGSLNALPQQAASYAFLRGEAKLVGYNATLQGGYFNHQPTGVTAKRSVGELELGYIWRAGSYGASASILRRSNEIKELSNGSGAQNFARLQFVYAM
ncbi:lipid A deacylase LpxR family protein [Undibacterium sp. Jales W-56]|uniref:lipid A deacylase LpxR family protein n=1 Tax=Undibacterium sp. Jales W-56 TaxID=2897325 RepID=UPI0021CF9EE3|nr:lipid A deacylase LpxR family protein [Undibacterium sp. Jales W-56]MCU6435433.1 lipid A deacylase LpxR family protein [Undibacterium sp. Jales W-56]